MGKRVTVINELPVMLKNDSTTMKTTIKNEHMCLRFAKSKEVQRHPQANAQLHHICFCPNPPGPPRYQVFWQALVC